MNADGEYAILPIKTIRPSPGNPRKSFDEAKPAAKATRAPDLPHDPDRNAALAGNPKCRVCGCTQDDCEQCVEKTGDACSWVPGEDPPLCTACAGDDASDPFCWGCGNGLGDTVDELALVSDPSDLVPIVMLPEDVQACYSTGKDHRGKRYLCAECMDKCVANKGRAKKAKPGSPQQPKPYAWDVQISLNGHGGTKQYTIVAPAEAQARRKAMLKPNAAEVVSLTSMTEEQYHLVHGHRRARV